MRTRTTHHDELVAKRDFLLASLRDLEREHNAGDVDDEDYEALRSSYVERAAAALRAIEAARQQEPAQSARRKEENGRIKSLRRRLGTRRARALLSIGAACCFVIVAGILAAELAGLRLPGDSTSGSVTLSSPEQAQKELVQASTLAGEGNVAGAIDAYDMVLASEPDNAEALTYKGWLERLAAIAAGKRKLLKEGDHLIEHAATSHPSFADAQGLYGVALVQDEGKARLALGYFRRFVADHPSSSLIDALAPTIKATFAAEGLVPPTGL